MGAAIPCDRVSHRDHTRGILLDVRALDDQPELFARKKARSRGPDLNVDRHDLARRQPLLTSVQMPGLFWPGPLGIEFPMRDPKPTESDRPILERVEKGKRDEAAGAVQLLQADEQVHIIRAIRFHPEPQRRVSGQLGRPGKAIGKDGAARGGIVSSGRFGPYWLWLQGTARRAEIKPLETSALQGPLLLVTHVSHVEALAHLETDPWPGIDVIGFAFQKAIEELAQAVDVCRLVVIGPFLAAMDGQPLPS